MRSMKVIIIAHVAKLIQLQGTQFVEVHYLKGEPAMVRVTNCQLTAENAQYIADCGRKPASYY